LSDAAGGRGSRLTLRRRPRSGRSIPPVPAGRPLADPGQLRIGASLLRLSLALAIGYGALATGLGYWQVMQAQQLSTDPRNPLILAAARQAPRGGIVDADGNVLARNSGGSRNEPRREYPEPAAAPVVGYRSNLFGTAGLERAYDAQLTGLLTLRAGDEFFRKFRSEPYDPSDVVVSLDLALQRAAARELGDRAGAVVAIEPSTGRVLALVSSPTFDPNRIADPSGSRAYLDELRGREDSPLLNRATQGQYVPGSVFKIVTATAGIGSGAINTATTFENQPEEYDTGFLVEGFRIRDAPRDFQTDRPLDFFEATEVSSNIWFAHAGLEIGPVELKAWAQRFGLGETIPFELAASSSQVTGGDGPFDGFEDEVELANAAYGQGEVVVTPLQMALVASTVANRGVLMKPKLVDELRAQSGAVTRLESEALRQVMTTTVAQTVGDAMQQAVEGRFGRILAGAAKVPGVPTAGKSGTAQLGGNEAPHSWFIGYAPANDPRIAIAVIVEHGGAGAQRAVPMAGELMQLYLRAD